MFGSPDALAIAGVRLLTLVTHADSRGDFTEIARASWWSDIGLVQWNLVRSRAGVLRGLHVHVRHSDLLCVVEGRATVALHDLRSASPSHGVSALVDLSSTASKAIVIPPGVLHGFHFPVPAAHLYAASEYWNPAEEMGCRWDDPALGLSWDVPPPLLSPRDAALPPLSALLSKMVPWQDHLTAAF